MRPFEDEGVLLQCVYRLDIRAADATAEPIVYMRNLILRM